VRQKLLLFAIVGTLVFSLAVLTGCEGLEELFGGGDPEDGRLTVSIAGALMDMCDGKDDDTILFAAHVYQAGSLIDGDTYDGWVALVAEYVVNGAASGTAFVVGDDSRPDWKGSGGKEYDIYPRLYCVTPDEGRGPPTKNDADFYTQDPEYVFRGVDMPWFRYTQDGNERLDTVFSEYAATE
jgi:hypothetical protein